MKRTGTGDGSHQAGFQRAGNPGAARVPSRDDLEAGASTQATDICEDRVRTDRLLEEGTNVVSRIIKHADLDKRLDRLAQDPDQFTPRARELVKELDAKGFDLEISDPSSWRKEASLSDEAPRTSVESQLRNEIDNISILDREAESRLARRVEFARLRLEASLEAVGMSTQDLEGGVALNRETTVGGRQRVDCALPPRVCRRWSELHALRTEMVERNLYLVLINVERYAHTTAGRPDLIQEGAAALFRAVDGFDWRRGLLFRTYAVHWLNQAFRSYLYNFGHTVRVPVYLQKAMKHVNQAIERLGDPNASVEAIARESQLAENIVATAMAASRTARSLDAPMGEDEDGTSLRDMLRVQGDEGPYNVGLEEHTLEGSIGDALDQLSERERYVISLRYGIGTDREHTLAEVAEKLGVSLERVRQIQVRAITKMRTPKLRRTVDPFLN
jgi:RNA polymerase sigma factor (sigma-70 family)